MLTANWSEAAAIFDAVVDLDEAERNAYLTAACSGNPSLRQDVEAMLLADAQASGIISGPILGQRVAINAEFQELDRVGPYEVIRLLGRGGMGAVYLARRVEDFQRLVAIKVIDRLIPDRATFRRFQRERQILSSLIHPNIARLYDGGLTESGMPYLVMEYAEGLPIDEYCEKHGLPIQERLRLFREVCAAVAYAHRHLVVHRDLKPANILVTQDGEVRLLDFGIARRLQDEDCDADAITRNEVLATPQFASPEQMAGARPSTNWDVFSLGKILAVILPRDVLEARGATLNGSGRFAVRLRNQEVVRDVRSIVSKATASEGEERYDSIGELIRDIESSLGGGLISARRLARATLVVSLVKRRFSLVASSAVILLVVLVSVTLFFAERQAARSRELVAAGLSSYLISLIKVTDPEVRTDQTISAIAVLDEGTRQARAHLPADSPEYIRIIREIGSLYFKIGGFRQAQNLLSEALTSSSGADVRFVAETYYELGKVLHIMGSSQDAEIFFGRSLETLKKPSEENSDLYSDVLEELALVAIGLNQVSKADSLANACLDIRKKWFGSASPRYAAAISLMAHVRWRARDYFKAEQLYLEALRVEKTASGSRSLQEAAILNDLGLVYVDMGQYQRAEIFLGQSLSIKESVLGVQHPRFATTLGNLAPVIGRRFGPDSAETIMRKVVSTFVESFGVDHHEVATAKNNLALYLQDNGRLDEAEREFRSALTIWKETVGDLHPDYLSGCHNLAILLRHRSKYSDAVDHYSQAIKGWRQLGGNYRTTLAEALNGLGKSYSGIGDLAGAAASFRESLAIRHEELPAGHWRIGTAMSLLGETLGQLGEREEAETMLRSGLEVLTAALGPDDEKTHEAEERLQRFRPTVMASAG